MSPAELIGVRSWHLEGRRGAPEDVISFELSSGETTAMGIDRREGSLLLRAVHPSMRWRVLDWEPHWSPSTRIEIRPSGDDHAAMRVIDRGTDVTAIYRVPPVVALAVARQGGLSVAVHRSLVGRAVRVEDDARSTAEIEEFGVFLSRVAVGPVQDQGRDQELVEL